MNLYYRPIARTGRFRPLGAVTLAGGWCWFDEVEVIERSGSLGIAPAASVPAEVLNRLTGARAPLGGLALNRPRIMGILNVTPDSFSDGGRFDRPEAALAQARQIAGAADMIDIGGESTRPGAADVPVAAEIARTAPLIRSLRAAGIDIPVSIDTRKADVAAEAIAAGAVMVNDVAALGFDPALAGVVAGTGVDLCLMHAQGTPATMQVDPRYDDVLLDVYDFLEARVARAEAAGIPRARIAVDPGIGFGKNLGHNLTLLRGLSLFHGLGTAILLGASRKRFIGTIGRAPEAADRGPGTIAVTLAGVAQGVQIHRVHDTDAVGQALRLWQAIEIGEDE